MMPPCIPAQSLQWYGYRAREKHLIPVSPKELISKKPALFCTEVIYRISSFELVFRDCAPEFFSTMAYQDE